MRRLSRYDISRIAWEAASVFAILVMTCAFLFSPLIEWFGQARADLTFANLWLAIVGGALATGATLLIGTVERWLGWGYKIVGMSNEEVSSCQPDLSVAAQIARKMEVQGIEGVRILDESGIEVPRSEWEAASRPGKRNRRRG